MTQRSGQHRWRNNESLLGEKTLKGGYISYEPWSFHRSSLGKKRGRKQSKPSTVAAGWGEIA